jgi:hypothetical protein
MHKLYDILSEGKLKKNLSYLIFQGDGSAFGLFHLSSGLFTDPSRFWMHMVCNRVILWEFCFLSYIRYVDFFLIIPIWGLFLIPLVSLHLCFFHSKSSYVLQFIQCL